MRSLCLLAALIAVVMAQDITDTVYLDVTIGDRKAGRIVLGLFGHTVPRTVQNFKHLVLGTQGYGYKGSIFHHVTRGMMIQGGDFEKNDGSGGKSIFGRRHFADENFDLQHLEGSLSMANEDRPNSNGSKFLIMRSRAPWMDGNHVVFGKVLRGMEVVRMIDRQSVDHLKAPLKRVNITDCGVL